MVLLFENFSFKCFCTVHNVCFVAQGHGDDVDYIKPAMVYLEEPVKAVLVSCGFNHTGAIFEFTEA